MSMFLFPCQLTIGIKTSESETKTNLWQLSETKTYGILEFFFLHLILLIKRNLTKAV